MAHTPFIFRPEDEDKKVYVVKQTYVMTVEQYVKAANEDEAFNVFLEHGGVKYEDIGKHLTNEKFDMNQIVKMSEEGLRTSRFP